MKKVVVTGGCGYIGSHTVVALMEKGYDVVSIDMLNRNQKYIQDNIRKITGKNLLNYEVNLCNARATRSILRDHRDAAGIIHFAAFKMVGESMEKPLRYYNNNLVSLMNVLFSVRDAGIRNFIYSSSSAVYGNVNKLPVTEETPVCDQQSPYGRSKYFGEKMIEDMVAISDLGAFILRYFNPAGSHDSALLGEPPEEFPLNIVPCITKAAAGKLNQLVVNGNDYPTRDGSCIRDYIHVMDVADAHILAMEYLMQKEGEKSYIEIANIGSGNGVSVLEMIKAFEEATGISVPYQIGPRRKGDVVAVYADYSKAQRLLGWQTKRSLKDMMSSAWKWEQSAANQLTTKN